MDYWGAKKKILVCLAHPDDPEFFCGATIAKWINNGHEVHYALLTKGERGVNDKFKDAKNIIDLRISEQQAAADVLGVKRVQYLEYEDGFLIPNLEIRKDIVRIIRNVKPEIVVTCDPTNYYLNDNYINHPDHRAAGQIVIDALFPAAQNKLFFPELLSEGLSPHRVEEVWLSLPKEANLTINVTDTWEEKVEALEKHASQIGDMDKFRIHMTSKAVGKDERGNLHYEEKFNRIIFSHR